jgi:hypothetical protein
MALRRRCGKMAGRHGAEKTSRVLDMKPPVIRRWRDQYGSPRSRKARGRKEAFVELKGDLTEALVSSRDAAALEIVGRNGTTIRVRAPLNESLLSAVLQLSLSSRDGV